MQDNHLGPFRTSPQTELARLPGPISPWVHTEKFQSGFRNEKRPNILATSSGAKERKQTWQNTKIITFATIIALATILAVSLQF